MYSMPNQTIFWANSDPRSSYYIVNGTICWINLVPDTPFHWTSGQKVKPEPFFRFLDLPRELRDMIYEFAIPDTYTPTRPDTYTPRLILKSPRYKPLVYPAGFIPSLCHANRQIRHEAMPVFIKTFRFELHGDHYTRRLTAWLMALSGRNAFKDIRYLEFPQMCLVGDLSYDFVDRNRQYKDAAYHMEFVRRCPALKEVRLTFCTYHWDPFPLGGVVERYRLRSLLDVEGLGILHLHFYGWRYHYEVLNRDEYQIFWELEKWFVEEFAARGKGTKVKVTVGG
ncbi:hypothetical protein BU16DRAFT_90764 [Lophium mytilinum]|uniref:2EXR domain-containing protein n=1 Tax=Lophium mytilinum TaxID=390894 RepID=A0A6A6QKC6_9PEZI|nr:hypothetical protein BU16DRAFT_90764 [Lophium mytilinum]